MGRISKLAVVCALAVTAVIASATAASAATGISLASGRALSAVTARGPVTFNFSGVNIICTVGVTLALNQSINKTAGAPVGIATLGLIDNCNGGYVGWIDNNIPVTYVSISGTLPSGITTMHGLGTGMLFTMTLGTLFATNRCQYRTNPAFALNGPGTSFLGGSFSGSASYNAGPGAPPCPSSGRITGAVLVLYGTLTSVAITLV